MGVEMRRDLLALRRRDVDHRVHDRLHPVASRMSEGGAMINPLRSEEDAFRFTLIVAVLVAPVVLVGGHLRAPAPRSAVAGGLALGLRRRPVRAASATSRSEKVAAAAPRRRRTARHRILVVANETLSGRRCATRSRTAAAGEDAELRVVCPALNTQDQALDLDEDDARAAGAASGWSDCSRRSSARASTPRATSATTIPCRRWRTRCGGSPPTR